jgi:hypothetical protein
MPLPFFVALSGLCGLTLSFANEKGPRAEARPPLAGPFDTCFSQALQIPVSVLCRLAYSEHKYNTHFWPLGRIF